MGQKVSHIVWTRYDDKVRRCGNAGGKTPPCGATWSEYHQMESGLLQNECSALGCTKRAECAVHVLHQNYGKTVWVCRFCMDCKGRTTIIQLKPSVALIQAKKLSKRP